MFQFGEVLTLAISAVAAAYLFTNWTRIRSAPTLRPFALPLIVMFVAWVATVVEGVFSTDVQQGWIVMMQESVGTAAGESAAAVAFNLVEHVGTTLAAVLLLVAVHRLCQGRPEDRR
jgi:hypothetical protein